MWHKITLYIVILVVQLMVLPNAYATSVTTSPKEKPVTIVAFGDSLVAGYGLAKTDAFPAILERHLSKNGTNVKVINAGVSGETTSGGRARLSHILSFKPDIVILVLGGNDILRGTPTQTVKDNLNEILKIFREQNIAVILGGMRAPKNLGLEYAKAFDPIYPELAKKYDAILDPVFLEGIFGNQERIQNDGLHPSKEGAEYIANRLLPLVKKALDLQRN